MNGVPQHEVDRMSSNKSKKFDMSRRSLLRKGAATSVVLGIGIPAFSGSAAATFCARTPGYWINHDWPVGAFEAVNGIPGVKFTSVEDGQEFLKAPTRGDKARIMATHFIAFVINNQAAFDACVKNPAVDVTGDGEKESMNKVANYTRQWLQELVDSGWTLDDGPEVNSWYVDEEEVPVPNGEVLKDAIDDYNNHLFDIEGCPCYEGDD